MRRSKSNPAKYVRNYRKVSQRRMNNEEEYMAKLVELDKQQPFEAPEAEPEPTSAPEAPADMDMSSLLSPELLLQQQNLADSTGGGGDYNSTLILPPKKKKVKSKKEVQLTPEELRHAKLAEKNHKRKMEQLRKHKDQKSVRAELYAKLESNRISQQEQQLYQTSSTRGRRRETKKQQLKRLLQREQAGLELTAAEQDLLYTTTTTTTTTTPTSSQKEAMSEDEEEMEDSAALQEDENESEEEQNGDSSNNKIQIRQNGKHRQKKNKKGQQQEEEEEKGTRDDTMDMETEATTKPSATATATPAAAPAPLSFAQQMMQGLSSLKSEVEIENEAKEKKRLQEAEQARLDALNKSKPAKPAPYVPSDPIVVQMPATTMQQEQEEGEDSDCDEEDDDEDKEEKPPQPKPTLWKSDTSNNNKSKQPNVVDKTATVVNRPEDVQQSRLGLPVCEMEYEIVDAIRHNAVTIICGETGSGKSTQVPQFCYEAGMAMEVANVDGNSAATSSSQHSHLLIGVTQPRRVAAVSTAKRVAYEMGCGDGKTIKGGGRGRGTGNTVAYQTRYETAGLGNATTKIKFMTDGVLLQEIQSDLLLRKYSTILLDEAHERNLNTDVLLGLLSASIQLRQEMSDSGGSDSDSSSYSLPPLKLVIMSATLRVEDFTSNPKLFPSMTPTLVKVPGRTYPVTIHHSKKTELDNYEQLAYQKVCQIHRKLPTGGILVFVTGKQEIVRLVTKLRRTLNPKPKKVSKKRRKGGLDNDDAPQSVALSFRDVQDNGGGDAGFRDMDDDEVDGEVLTGGNEHDAILDSDNDDLDEDEDDDEDDDEDGESLRQPVHVLPLYSMLSADDQAKVFGDVPENHRLIVISTNIAETSVTIPGISYVVDCGRQKCRNYNASTNISTYDIMWISKASADQRAGRAGRTGPGHCYRLFSSSVYARQFEAFAVPEILLKPLEDVVLTMKAMNIPSVAQFPFATPPHPKQLQSALRLLNNIGCITPSEDSHNTKAASFDLTKYDQEAKERALNGGNDNSKDDGRITTLGRAVAKLPLNVRFGKMLLMGLQGQVLDYAIVVVAILSEVSPFVNAHEAKEEEEEDDNDDENNDKKKNNNDDNDDTNQKQNAHQIRNQWTHQEGDVLAALAAVGAYSYAAASAAASAADNNKGGISSSKRGRKNKSNNVTADASDATATAKAFCDDHGLNHVVMERIQKLRQQLARLVKLRLGNIVDVNGGGKLSKSIKSSNHSVAIRTGGISLTMAPPTKLQENLLRQLVLSGLLDNVARLAPVGSLSGEYPLPPRAAYISCNGAVTEPLWIDRHSFMYTRDFRRLSEYVCFDSLVRKVQKGRPGTSGNASMPTTVSFMTTVTPLSPAWLGVLAQDSPLLTTGDALDIPAPKYDTKTHQIMCSVETHYGAHGWNLPPLRVPMVEEVLLSSKSSSNNAAIVEGDQYRWLARWILEGKLLSADNNDNNEELMDCWNDSPSLITKRRNVPIPKVVNLVSALGVHNIDSIPKLQQHWATKDKTFLFRQLKAWTKTESQSYKAKVKQLWIALVEQNMEQWKNRPQQEE